VLDGPAQGGSRHNNTVTTMFQTSRGATDPYDMSLSPSYAPAIPTAPGPSVASTEGFLVGVVDGQWRIEQVSATGADLLHSTPKLGASLLERVHVSDRAALLDARTRAIEEQEGTALEVHIGQPGRWSLVRLAIAPMVGQASWLGFVLSARGLSDPSPDAVRLQKHLDRIGRELEAAGLDVHRDDGIDVNLLPAATELSPRQWEVLHRLLRGERVPGIARELFLSTSTVRNHLAAVFAVVGVHSQEELLTLFRRPSTPVRVAS
jgi:DNA-binding CsgD family transcriptional regulator